MDGADVGREVLTQNIAKIPDEFFGSFNDNFYSNNNIDVDFQTISPIMHYMTLGWKEGRDPNHWFSVSGYLQRNPDVAAALVEPLSHYLAFGYLEKRLWSEIGITPYEIVGNNFDHRFYLRTYTDIDVRVVNAVEHYIVYGWKEGRNPASWFSTCAYLNRYDDVRSRQIEPFYHYLTLGRSEGRLISDVGESDTVAQKAEFRTGFQRDYARVGAEFDDAFYALCYPDLTAPDVDRFEHFMVHGWVEGRNPASWFNTKLYLDAHPDIAERHINPFVHYIIEGRSEGRSIFSAINERGRTLQTSPGVSLIADRDISFASSLKANLTIHKPAKFNPNSLNIHWVVPDFSPGSGGHSTIFRIVRWLEFFGHRNTIWFTHLVMHGSIADVYDDIVKYFQPLKADVRVCDDSFALQNGDAVIATGWQTVSHVSQSDGFLGRFYFVQDFEPAFYPVGSQSICAELTYHLDLGCICASEWLAEKLTRDYDRWTRSFKLAYDNSTYFPLKTGRKRGRGKPFRIAVYARASTARRCVDLALLALEELARDEPNIEVTLFSAEMDKARAPYPCKLYGVMNPSELADLYRSSDLGICFSATNYSLIPQEMMACGLPVLELNSESSRRIFPDGVVTLTGPSPGQICRDIQTLIRNPTLLSAQRRKAFKWIEGLTWADAARGIHDALVSRLETLNHTPKTTRKLPEQEVLKASICIPTYNGGDLLLEVIQMVRQQVVPWQFEIVVVDSGSTDGMPERLAQLDGVTCRSILQTEFGHGRTRNLLASISSGEFIIFLTQDAKPKDVTWLYSLVSVMEHFPDAAGAFGRHVAYPDSSAFTKISINEHFSAFESLPIAVSRDTNRDKWETDQEWRQKLHFFSDNNSCLRRSAWERIPYPDIAYGEDQVWAETILEAGYQRVYVPSAVVYHSHDYTPQQVTERALIETAYFKKHFGYELYDRTLAFERQLADMNGRDQRMIVSHGLSMGLLDQRKLYNEALLKGRYLAACADDDCVASAAAVA